MEACQQHHGDTPPSHRPSSQTLRIPRMPPRLLEARAIEHKSGRAHNEQISRHSPMGSMGQKCARVVRVSGRPGILPAG
eukprot:scaffold36300_cov123-Isochrysis_galbana.AAC.11